MQEHMGTIGRVTEAISAGIDLGQVDRIRSAAAALSGLLSEPRMRNASEELAWHDILEDCRADVERVRFVDSVQEARVGLRRIEASCWRCHEQYIGPSEAWASR